jgi:hypothetical protein
LTLPPATSSAGLCTQYAVERWVRLLLRGRESGFRSNVYQLELGANHGYSKKSSSSSSQNYSEGSGKDGRRSTRKGCAEV